MLKSLFHKIASLQGGNFNEQRLQHGCFPVNIAIFLRAANLKNICGRPASVLNGFFGATSF